jgi:hypothetical protein
MSIFATQTSRISDFWRQFWDFRVKIGVGHLQSHGKWLKVWKWVSELASSVGSRIGREDRSDEFWGKVVSFDDKTSISGSESLLGLTGVLLRSGLRGQTCRGRQVLMTNDRFWGFRHGFRRERRIWGLGLASSVGSDVTGSHGGSRKSKGIVRNDVKSHQSDNIGSRTRFRSLGEAPKERSGQAGSLELMRFDAKSSGLTVLSIALVCKDSRGGCLSSVSNCGKRSCFFFGITNVVAFPPPF